MTTFEFITLLLIYFFSVAFTHELLYKVQMSILNRITLSILILFVAPVFTTVVMGAYLADMINKHLEV